MPLTQVDQGLLGTNAQYTGFKNRIINGGMVIDQRNAGASVAISNNTATYTADRWMAYYITDGAFSVQQTTTAPTGFSNSLKVTITTADSSLASTQYGSLQQRIEGFNFADLMYGTANAQTVTVSFWVRSSVTGQYGGSFTNSDFSRSYPFSYTISAADTWEQKSITIPGDTSGTWVGATNGVGLRVSFALGVGSSYLGTANTWAATTYISATGQTNLLGTNGATFFITGVQLEKGSTATSFDYRPYGTELQLCQRYYEVGVNVIQAYGNNTNGVFAGAPFKVTKRATPTVVNQGVSFPGQTTLVDFTLNAANPSYAGNYSTVQTATINAYEGSAPATGMVRYQGYFTASAEL